MLCLHAHYRYLITSGLWSGKYERNDLKSHEFIKKGTAFLWDHILFWSFKAEKAKSYHPSAVLRKTTKLAIWFC